MRTPILTREFLLTYQRVQFLDTTHANRSHDSAYALKHRANVHARRHQRYRAYRAYKLQARCQRVHERVSDKIHALHRHGIYAYKQSQAPYRYTKRQSTPLTIANAQRTRQQIKHDANQTHQRFKH